MHMKDEYVNNAVCYGGFLHRNKAQIQPRNDQCLSLAQSFHQKFQNHCTWWDLLWPKQDGGSQEDEGLKWWAVAVQKVAEANASTRGLVFVMQVLPWRKQVSWSKPWLQRHFLFNHWSPLQTYCWAFAEASTKHCSKASDTEWNNSPFQALECHAHVKKPCCRARHEIAQLKFSRNIKLQPVALSYNFRQRSS